MTDFSGATALTGLLVLVASAGGAAVTVLLWRRLDVQPVLRRNLEIITNVYPIVGLVYGVFLGFTIVITWTHFQEAEDSVAAEVTHLSELWRDAGTFPDSVRAEMRGAMVAYVDEVLASDWDSLALARRHSPQANAAYEAIWRAYYAYQPETPTQASFYSASLGELNNFGRARRERSLDAAAEVQPLVKWFLLGGGAMMVLFSLLIPAESRAVQVGVTSCASGLIFFSIFLALALQMPFSGSVSVSSEPFLEIQESFQERMEADDALTG